MYAIVREEDLTVLFGPTAWNPVLFAANLQKLGVYVSLSTTGPTNVISVGGFRIVPVVDDAPTIDPDIQTYTVTKTVTMESVVYSYALSDLPIEHVVTVFTGKLDTIRREKEEAGIIVDGLAVSTKREHRTLMLEAYSALSADRTTISFNTGLGYVTLTAAQVEKIVAAVKEHAQKCYDAANLHYTNISKMKTGAEIRNYFSGGEVPQVMTNWP